MFYCNDCADKRTWPRSWFKSHGTCEICEKVGECNDVPPKDLPEKKEVLQNEK